jgi:hypothetical protein
MVVSLDADSAVICKIPAVARRGWSLVCHELASYSAWNRGASISLPPDASGIVFFCVLHRRALSDTVTWPVFNDSPGNNPATTFGFTDGILPAMSDLSAPAPCVGTGQPEWRSGVKHDCS